ncbi:hypothetical protein ACVWW4_000153 [Bradyrhizobium sp. LB7.1]
MSVWTKWRSWLGVSPDRSASTKETPRNNHLDVWWLMPAEPSGVCVSELLFNRPSDGAADTRSEDMD